MSSGLDRGLFVAFEGIDGSGKTTAMAEVANQVSARLTRHNLQISPISTRHPGSTPLGQHIRRLVKFPESISSDIRIDELSRQMLYLVDMASFVRTILEPALANNQLVFADRHSYVSSIVYGLADGLKLGDIQRLLSVLTIPKTDRLYILRCPWDIGRDRVIKNRAGAGDISSLDHYDKQSKDFYKRVASIYDNLIVASAEQTALVSQVVAVNDVIYVDATSPPQNIVQFIVDDLVSAILERCVFSSLN